MIAAINNLILDLVLLTGDYVHQTARAIPHGIGLFASIRARLGVAGVLGNHDHWEDTAACRAAFNRTNIPLVDNRRLFLDGSGFHTEPIAGEALVIAGVGDLYADAFGFEGALGRLDPVMPRILLSHNPDTAEMLPETLRADLLLAGHTHGGQVSPPFVGAPWAPTRYGTRYVGGWCEGPRCPVIVSRGVGMAGVPLRVGVPSEFGLITLIAK